jgi:glycerol-3-phosphate acyltransferase PlsY
MILLLILVIIAYLVGSIPTGFLFCRYFFNLDITQHGSGNIGATNVARVLGKRYFLLVFFIDAIKAWAVIYAGMLLCGATVSSIVVIHVGYVLACALLVGNAYSVFLGFSGGKGVASTVGIIAALLPIPFVICFMGCWAFVLVITKQPFVASLAALFVMMVSSYYLLSGMSTTFFFAIWVWVAMRHFPNLRAWYTLQIR